MKSTGIVRKVDDLGRIVIPIELRRKLHIAIKDPLEIHVEGEHIILAKPADTCIFCGSTENPITFREKVICESCVNELEGDQISKTS